MMRVDKALAVRRLGSRQTFQGVCSLIRSRVDESLRARQEATVTFSARLQEFFDNRGRFISSAEPKKCRSLLISPYRGGCESLYTFEYFQCLLIISAVFKRDTNMKLRHRIARVQRDSV